MKTIAVDLDDTLNDLGATLQREDFPPDTRYGLAPEVFAAYLQRVRSGPADEGDLLSTAFATFQFRIYEECYRRARPRADGVVFMRWLRAQGWRIVICTHRDLRRVQEDTRRWLGDCGIPFDHLFMAGNKIAFCELWGITHLVDDEPFNLAHGRDHGVQVYYPLGAKHAGIDPCGARGFRHFDEIKAWIEE